MSTRRIFVTGTDTGVGKTVVSAGLLMRLRRESPVRYWKPVQTGTLEDDDTETVTQIAAASARELLKAGIRLPEPLSPHLAARLAGQHLTVEDLAVLASVQAPDERWIIEGAGGVLVPLNERELMIDLIEALAPSVVIVVRDRLGAINHALLTIDALRSRDLSIEGVVMVGTPHRGNREAIETYGRVRTIGVLPWLEPLTAAALAREVSSWQL